MIRIPYLALLNNEADFLTATNPVAIWGIIELGLGLIAACMVTLKPLFKLLYNGASLYNMSSKGYAPNTGRSQRGNRAREFVELGNQKVGGVRMAASESEVELNDLEANNKEIR